MSKNLLRFFVAILLSTSSLWLVACAKSEVTTPTTNTSSAVQQSPTPSPATDSASAHASATTPGKIDVCALLTTSEIQSIQGEPLKETKLSSATEGGFLVSQCFFSLPTFANSINVVVTQKAEGNGARDPREFWKETFDKSDNERRRESKEEREKERKANRQEEEEKEGAPPKKIVGLGDEAFWQGSRVGGALYVLKGNKYIRISIGGGDDQQTKVNKAKALAVAALKRL